MRPLCNFNVADPVTTRYMRTHNTAVAETEKRLNGLYGAWRTILCNSGMEAVGTALALVQPETVIVDDSTYFETREWLAYAGYKVIKIHSFHAVETLRRELEWVRQKTRGPILLMLDNPTTFGEWYDIDEIRETAHGFEETYLCADNSVCSLYYSQPVRHGADICVESYTKYVCGHGDVFAGGVALAPSMKWLEEKPVPRKCPGLDSVGWIVSRRGNVVSPLTSYMVDRGLDTLGVRMEAHTEGARLISDALKREGVKCLYAGVGGLITLPEKTESFCKRLKKFVTVGTFGMTYSNADFFRSTDRYPQGFCARLSVGLEDPYELLADVLQALEGETQ